MSDPAALLAVLRDIATLARNDCDGELALYVIDAQRAVEGEPSPGKGGSLARLGFVLAELAKAAKAHRAGLRRDVSVFGSESMISYQLQKLCALASLSGRLADQIAPDVAEQCAKDLAKVPQ